MFKIAKNHGQGMLNYETMMFPGGEYGIKLDTNNLFYKHAKATHQTIIARMTQPGHIVELHLLVDALRRFDSTPIRLVLPYVPYARQDRVCVEGEAHSLKVFADMINSLGFESVVVFDPHSDVVGAVLNNVKIVSQKEIVAASQLFIKKITESKAVLISPDAGGNKKTAELTKFLGLPGYIRADKLRDLNTGKILETIVYADEKELSGATVAIVDDICDGGRTFVELAKALKSKGAKEVILFVTHGIFSKGIEALTKHGIDDVFTTTSFEDYNNPKALNIETTFHNLL